MTDTTYTEGCLGPDLTGYHCTLNGFTYVYNGSLTVNVWRNDRYNTPVNFDAFTLEDKATDQATLRGAIVRRHNYALSADARYTLEAPTRDQLLYGA